MVNGEAEGFEVGLDLRDEVGDPRVIGCHEVDREAGDARLGKEGLRAFEIVGKLSRGLLVGRVRLGEEGGCLNGLAFHTDLNELLLVDCLVDRLADLRVVEGGLHHVEHEEGVAIAGHGVNRPACGLELIDRRGGNRFHDIGCAVEGGGEARGVVLEDVPAKGLAGGRVSAVVELVGHRGDLGRRDRLVLVGACANRVRLELVVGHGSRDDLHVREAGGEVGEGIVELDGDRLVILGGHGLHEVEELAVDRAFGGRATVGAQDVLGSDVLAVGELRTVAEGDLVLGVGDRHRVAARKGGEGLVIGHIELVEAFEDLKVRSDGERRGGDRAVVGGLVGDTGVDLAAEFGRRGVTAGRGICRGSAAAGGEGQCGRRHEGDAPGVAFSNPHKFSPHHRVSNGHEGMSRFR
ncbi:Uncharacterised protein [Chlamydia trachomatis]|nr:Uncharacterised protein [Chlamydia trachomatis]